LEKNKHKYLFAGFEVAFSAQNVVFPGVEHALALRAAVFAVSDEN
jgi:hypothetical protein